MDNPEPLSRREIDELKKLLKYKREKKKID